MTEAPTHLSMSHEGKEILRQIVEATGKIVPSHYSAWISTNVSNDDWLAVLDYGAALEAERDELRAALKALSASIFVPNDDRSPDMSTALEMTVSALAKAEEA